MEIDLSQFKFGAYYRKSSDREDRQVQSIPDQKKELAPLIAEKKLNIIDSFEDEKSAKRPGRKDFNRLMEMIEHGKINAIVGWKINRLARNPIDGAKLQWLLQEGTLKAIVTPSKIYLPTDNVLLMAVEQGIATQFSLDLSIDVTRGMKSKVDKGWRPMRAPIGYLNDPVSLKGEKRIYKDPDRFDLVKNMWQLMLTGGYTVRQIVDIANEQWFLRTKATKKMPSHRLTIGATYKMFTRTFYYGEYTYKGENRQGKHEPMITKEQYDLVQTILGRKGKPRPHNKRLPFAGVISCGGCGSMVTPDEKHKFVKRENRVVQWIYHRCAKSKKTDCHQPQIKYEDLKEQIEKYLDAITIPPEFLNWALQVLRNNNEAEEQTRSQMIANQRKVYDECLERIQNLINFYVSPDNAKRELLTDEEYKVQKVALTLEKEIGRASCRERVLRNV
jgi:site-specific DNA recombinase